MDDGYCIVSDVWGFDEAAVQVLKKMKPADTDNLVRKYGILLDTNSSLLPENTKNVGTVSHLYKTYPIINIAVGIVY